MPPTTTTTNVHFNFNIEWIGSGIMVTDPRDVMTGIVDYKLNTGFQTELQTDLTRLGASRVRFTNMWTGLCKRNDQPCQ